MKSLLRSGSKHAINGRAKQIWSRMTGSKTGYAKGLLREYWGKLLLGFMWKTRNRHW